MAVSPNIPGVELLDPITGLPYLSGGLATSSTAAVSSVASSATSVTLAASNVARKCLAVFNDSTQILYLSFAAVASTSAHTVQILAGGYWEMPGTAIYTGIVSGIWASANGSARITEY